jgi:hypothetical protein
MGLGTGTKPQYEAPRLVRLAAPGGAKAACIGGSGDLDGCIDGSSASGCNSGGSPGYAPCMTGPQGT